MENMHVLSTGHPHLEVTLQMMLPATVLKLWPFDIIKLQCEYGSREKSSDTWRKFKRPGTKGTQDKTYKNRSEFKNIIWSRRKGKALITAQYHHESASLFSAMLNGDLNLSGKLEIMKHGRKWTHVPLPGLRISPNQSQIKHLSIGDPRRLQIPPQKIKKTANKKEKK